jgi:hypothetical protein
MDQIRTQVNITLWLVTVRRELAATTDPKKRALLRAIYAELAGRL